MSDPLDKLIIYQHELDNLNRIRSTLHEIAEHNPQVSHDLQTLTVDLWQVINKRRELESQLKNQ